MPKLKNVNHELFCQTYAGSTELFGNGTQSYVKAYKIDVTKKGALKSAKTSAYRLLTNDDILNRINEILEEMILNDGFVDKQLAFLITQNADFSAKMKGITEYNKLKKRITEKKQVTHIGLGDILSDISDTEPTLNDG